MSALDPALRPVLEVVAARLERRGLQASGRIRVSDLDRAARHALGGLLGRAVVQDRFLLDLGELDQIARDRLLLDGGIVAACEQVLARPLVDRAAQRQHRIDERARWHAPLTSVTAGWAADWAEQVARSGLLARCPDPERTARRAAAIVTELRDDPEALQSRTELAARMAGDAHALDDGTVLAACVLRALALDAGEQPPRTPLARQELWSRYGVSTDRVSTTVLALGLRASGNDRVARWLAEAAQARAAVHLTATDLDGLVPLVGDAPVLVCENPRVLEAATQRSAPVTVVCGMGRPTTVVLRLLARLASRGHELRYHGDFDWPGIAIAHQLRDGVGAQPWSMRAVDYLAGVARGPAGVPLTGAPGPTPWDEDLSRVMAETGLAVHEELLLPELLDRW